MFEFLKSLDWYKVSGSLLIFGGFVLTIIKHFSDKKREFQKKFFEEQLKIYMLTVEKVSLIAVYPKEEDKVKNAILEFMSLFYGKMSVIEDKDVQKIMEVLKDKLLIYENINDKNEALLIQKEIQDLSLALAHFCRNSSIKTWGLKFKMKRFTDFTIENKKLIKSKTSGTSN